MRVPAAAIVLRGACLLAILATGPAASAHAAASRPTPTVSELTGGVTPGFTPNSYPDGITTGPDGHIWFTEYNGAEGTTTMVGLGAVGRVNDDGTVTELKGDITPGFSVQGGPEAITTGPDGRIWFAEYLDPGRLGVVLDTRAVSELTGGVRSGFSADSSPGSTPCSMTTGADGHIWFTEWADTGLTGPGRLGEVVGGVVHELTGGTTPGFSPDRGPVCVTSGPDGHIWFTEGNDPGAVGRNNNDGTVTEMTAGATRGFSKDAGPYGITTGPDGKIWFTEATGPGGIARVNDDGTVTELVGGVTPGFRKNSRPENIITGPDGHLWFTEYASPSGLARVNDDGTVSEFAAGSTPGFSGGAGPTGLTSGPDGRVWFAEYDRAGIGRITVGPGVLTGGSSTVGAASATLTGAVRPNGQQTVFRFEYGRTSAYGRSTSLSPAGSGVGPTDVDAVASGLQPGTLYHYRLVATNDTDTTLGDDRTFTTTAGAGGCGFGCSDIQPPSTPAHFHGRFTSSVLRLTWSSAADNVGVDHYQVYRDGKPLARISARLNRASLRGFRTRSRTVFTVRALDAAGNQSPASNPVSVTARVAPARVPRVVPGWAGKLLAWERHGRRGSRPVTPARLPAWYARWRAWKLQPYRIVSGR